VTVIGGEKTFTEEQLNDLRNHGSEVERIYGDGTTIATQLAER
jgi:putative cell wall-binding protein